MANDRTTSAREFLFAESKRDTAPERLSDWLIRDLKGARRSSAPPPPESHVEAAPAEPVESALEEHVEPLAAEHDASLAEANDEPAAPAAVDLTAEAVSHEVGESDDLAESLSYAREAADEHAAPDTSPAPEAVAAEPVAAEPVAAEPVAADAVATEPVVDEPVDTNVYADPEDWLDDDRDSETTAAFFTPKPVLEDTDDDLAPADAGESLSPQVLAPEDENDDGGAVVVAGVGGVEWWKVAAGVAAAVLLLFMVVHRTKKAPPLAAAAHADIVAPATPPNAAPPAAQAEAEADEPASDGVKGSHGEYFGGTRHMSSTDSTSQDPSPGGPSVARFPDLPREVLMQLEQAFEAGEQQHEKSVTGSVERY